MFDRARPATRVTLTVLLAGAVALQQLMPLVSGPLAIGLFGFVVGAVLLSLAWLLCAVPDADVPPPMLDFMLLLATVGPGFALLLTWLFGDELRAAA
jgi:hypothetical protein